jgi:hypothetical protein
MNQLVGLDIMVVDHFPFLSIVWLNNEEVPSVGKTIMTSIG